MDLLTTIFSWGHPFSTYAKFSGKLTFFTLVRVRGSEMLVFQKLLLRTEWVIPILYKNILSLNPF